MKKLLACTFGLALITAIGGSVFYLVEGDFWTNNENDTKTKNNAIDLARANTVFSQTRDLQSRYKDFSCLKDNFEWITWTHYSSRSTRLSSIPRFNEDQINGCLIVRQNTKLPGNRKSYGNFKLVWSIFDNKQGLIAEINIKKKDGIFDGEAFVYFLKSNGNYKSNWIVKNAKELRKQKAEDLEKWMPQPGELLEDTEANKKNWGFDTDRSSSNSGVWLANKVDKDISTKWHLNIEKWFKGLFKWDISRASIKNLKLSWVNSRNRKTPNTQEKAPIL